MYCDEDQNNQELPTKDGDTIFDHLRCSVCNGTISEFRYTCVQCSEFDLCGACEADRAHHHHYVLRVPAPRPFAEVQFVLATIRQHLMKKLDPITAGAAQEFEDGSVMPEVKLEVEYEENENNGDVEDNGDDNDNSDNENDNSDSEDDGDDSDSDNDNDSDNIVDSNKRDGEPEQEKKYDGRLKTSDVPAPLTDDFNTQKSVDISIKMEPMSDSPEHEVSTDQVSTLPTPSTAKRLITIKRPDTINMDEGASAAKKICVEPVSNTLRGSREKLIRVTASKTQEPCHDDPEIGQDCMEMPK